jgi:hypothetical protein
MRHAARIILATIAIIALTGLRLSAQAPFEPGYTVIHLPAPINSDSQRVRLIDADLLAIVRAEQRYHRIHGEFTSNVPLLGILGLRGGAMLEVTSGRGWLRARALSGGVPIQEVLTWSPVEHVETKTFSAVRQGATAPAGVERRKEIRAVSLAPVPASRPRLKREAAEALLREGGVTDGFGLLGVRGYYFDSMGQKGQNDRGIYDDAIFGITPTAFVAFNANVDPSAFRAGIATLKPGTYLYQIGIHGLRKPPPKQYKALVQAGLVSVVRDGGQNETGRFGINIHRGSYKTTSSLGCQTIYPDQWPEFIALIEREMTRHARRKIPYVLREGTTLDHRATTAGEIVTPAKTPGVLSMEVVVETGDATQEF